MLKTLKMTALVAGACTAMATGLPTHAQELSGSIEVDGSSTVFPITQAVAEEFMAEHEKVRISVGISGTGGGFKRFATSETDISDASRPIKASEAKVAAENGVKFIEIPVAYDGLTIVVNKNNTWVDKLTVEQLAKIYLAKHEGTVSSWKDIDASWPDVKLNIFSPGTDSGTFDYFKEVVAGKGDAMRANMSVSEDDNVLVRGVIGDRGGIGYFGCAYFFENEDKLKAVPIVNSDGKAIAPTPKTIEGGSYEPFSRPLFIYVNAKSLDRPEVSKFIDFYLAEGGELAEEVGYVRLPGAIYDRARANVKSRKTGTQYTDADGKAVHGPVMEVYK